VPPPAWGAVAAKCLPESARVHPALYDTAYKDYELRIEHREQNIAPFPVLLDYHQQMMSLVHKGELTPDLVTKIFERQGVMTAAVLKALDSPQEPASQPESQT
jgi:hypothetical protein